MNKTEWVLNFIAKSELENCINLYKNRDNFGAIFTLRRVLEPRTGMLGLKEAIDLMQELVKEASIQNNTETLPRFQVSDNVYFYHEGHLQNGSVSDIEIDSGSVTYKIWDGKDDISRLEDELFPTAEEAYKDHRNYLITLTQSF